ncbi:MAG: T9SS type A sorting domain-containing protein [Bacteroidota bacterium]
MFLFLKKPTHTIKRLCALLIILFFLNSSSFAAASGDYRSAATGNWSTLATWQRYNGATWVIPTAAQGCPGIVAATSNILIVTGHVITFDVANTKDMGSTLFQVDGTLIVSAILNLQKKAAVVINGTLRFTGNNYISQFSNGLGVAADFTVNSTATIQTQNPAGLAASGTTGSIQIIPGHNTVTFSSAAQYIYDGTTTQVTGSYLPNLTSGGSLTISNTGGVVSLSQAFTIGTGATLTVSAADTLATAYAITKTGSFNINGAFQLNSGGSVSAAPTYGSSSTLIYNQTGSPTFGSEWTGNGTTSGVGIPQNVVIKNSTTLTLPTTDRGIAGNLDITSGTLTLNVTSGNLYVGGNWTRSSSGTFNPNGRVVHFNGSSNTTVRAPENTTRNSNGSFGGETFAYLTLNKGALATSLKILSNITVTRTLTLTRGTLDLDTSDVLLPSNTTVTADIAAVNTTNANINYSSTGRFIIQRFIKNTSTIRTWRFLTAPLDPTDPLTISNAWQEGMTNTNVSTPNTTNPWTGFGTHITGSPNTYNASLGFDKSVSNNGYSIEYFDNSGATNKWLYPANTNSTRLMSQSAWGLFIRGDRSFVIGDQYKPSASTTLEPKGKIIIGDVTRTVVAGKTNLVGNPYACEINMTNVSIGGAVRQQYKLWDPKAFTNYTATGKYVTFTWISGTNYIASNAPVSWASGTPIPGVVESSAAFFATPATSSVVFHESDKVSGTSSLNGIQSRPMARDPADKVAILRTNLAFYDDSVSNFVNVDGTLNLYNRNYNTEVDAYEDAVAPITSSTTGAIRILKGGKQLSISKEQSIASTDTIFLNLSQLKKVKHQLVLSAFDFDIKANAFLIDKYLSTETPILKRSADTSFYDFDVTTDPLSNAADRFMIVFKARPVILPVTISSVKAGLQNNNDILVKWKVENEINIIKYEVERSIDGFSFKTIDIRNVIGSNNTSNVYNLLDVAPIEGNNYYRVKSIDASGQFKYSQIVKVALDGSQISSINIYPNTIKNNMINLQLNNQSGGLYHVRLINNDGRSIYKKEINVSKGNSNQVLKPTCSLSAGIYHLEIVNISNQKTFQKLIIE